MLSENDANSILLDADQTTKQTLFVHMVRHWLLVYVWYIVAWNSTNAYFLHGSN